MRVGWCVVALALALPVGGGVACVQQPPPRGSDAAASRALEAALLALPGRPDPGDAARLARAALDATADLHARYRPLRPPQLGNMAFHMGLRERALCCHWAQDLLRALSRLELRSFDLHWGVAHHGSSLREHNTVVAVPKGARFEQGLVLDPWRDSGRLTYVRADRDRYPWKLHPADAVRDRLACTAGG